MTDQRLPPRVEDAEHANLRTEMAGIGGDLTERRRACLKEPPVQTRAIPRGQRQPPILIQASRAATDCQLPGRTAGARKPRRRKTEAIL